MIVMAYVLPQIVYRVTSAQWLLPLAPLIRAVGLLAKPFVAVLDFFQSLVDLTDDSNGDEEPPTQAENIEARISA